MLLRATKIRLFLFAMIAVAGIAYVGGTHAGPDRLFGARGYHVTVQLADSGGDFPNAEVTYRGVTVGWVERLALSDDGVDVILDIDDATPRSPPTRQRSWRAAPPSASSTSTCDRHTTAARTWPTAP